MTQDPRDILALHTLPHDQAMLYGKRDFSLDKLGLSHFWRPQHIVCFGNRAKDGVLLRNDPIGDVGGDDFEYVWARMTRRVMIAGGLLSYAPRTFCLSTYSTLSPNLSNAPCGDEES